jgi:hypothetical protein
LQVLAASTGSAAGEAYFGAYLTGQTHVFEVAAALGIAGAAVSVLAVRTRAPRRRRAPPYPHTSPGATLRSRRPEPSRIQSVVYHAPRTLCHRQPGKPVKPEDSQQERHPEAVTPSVVPGKLT